MQIRLARTQDAPASLWQPLLIPARGGSPGAAGAAEPYAGFGGKIALPGTAYAMEYRLSSASDWTAIPIGATEIPELDPGDYLVRYRAKPDDMLFASQPKAVTVTASAVDPAWAVSLAPDPVTFAAPYGYTVKSADLPGGFVSPVTVTVSNAGNQPTGPLAISLGGADSASFELSEAALGSIPPGGTATFTVVPAEGLAAGSYSATVTAGGGIPDKYSDRGWAFTDGSAALSFAVSSAEISGFGEPAHFTAGKAGEVPSDLASEAGITAFLNAAYATVTAVYEGGEQPGVPVTWAYSGKRDDGAIKEYTPNPLDTSTNHAQVGLYEFTGTVGSLPANIANTDGLTAKMYVVVNDVLHAISLDAQGTFAFPSAKYGYAQPEAQAVAIRNIGTEATEDLAAALSGADMGAFELSASGVPSIDVGDEDTTTLTARPKPGLTPNLDGSARTYTATLTVTGGGVSNADLVPKSYGLSFTVHPNDITGFGPVADLVFDYNGKDAAEVIGELPASLEPTLSNATAAAVAVSWAADPSYSRTAPGDYAFTGDLTSGIAALGPNYSNPQGITEVTARVTVLAPVNAETPMIWVNPEGYSGIAEIGTTRLLEAHLAPLAQTGGALSYKWFSGTANAYTGGEISGATGSALDVPTGSPGTRYYWYEATHTNTASHITGSTAETARSDIAKVALRYAVLTLKGGTAAEGPGGSEQAGGGAALYRYPAGETVEVTAAAPPAGYRLDGWEATGAAIADLHQSGPAFAFTMPLGDLGLAARYAALPQPTYTPSSGGGGDAGPAAPAQEPGPAPEDTAGLPFVDVVAGDWFYGDVYYMYERGLMLGTGDETFEPHSPITRAMAVTILYRYEQASVSGGAIAAGAQGLPFGDVAPGLWYTEAVAWGAEKGIVVGYGDGRFGPEDSVTREQLAAMLYRYEQIGGRVPADVSAGLEFADWDSVSGYARPATGALAAQGVIEGRPGNIFDPHSTATRAEVAAVFRRYISAIG
jgi:hypothetical protein